MWYKKIKNKQKKKKTAAVNDHDIVVSDESDTDLQQGHFFDFYDVQRYVLDSYMAKLGMSTTSRKITVALTVAHYHLGTMSFVKYWSFDKDEKDQAIEIYNKIANIIKETITRFTDEEIPTPLFWTHLKAATDKIKTKDYIKTYIPYVLYSRDIEYEPDWRKSIYGTRYPGYDEHSYNQSSEENEIVKFPGTQT